MVSTEEILKVLVCIYNVPFVCMRSLLHCLYCKERFIYYVCILDGLSVNDIGNDKHQGSVLVSVPLTAAQRQRSVSQMQNENEKKGISFI